jgi:cytochrome d ubiquinol oxidase subunit II
METVWFIIVSLMVATYVVLDGFDFGAGILHLFVAKTDEERRSIFAAIGPLWDGNEVWLLAGGGVLVFAFPRAYAAGFSGFYLPLIMVLWLLIMRGISIEFRSMEKSPIWRSFWDGTFFLSSALMAIVLGAALGNVVRGVPLNSEGFFSGPLFTNFMPGPNPGVLDWFTVTIGLFTLAVLALHGALYLRMKTEGKVEERTGRLVMPLWIAALVLGLVSTLATMAVQPKLFEVLGSRPILWPLVGIFVACFVAIPFLPKRLGQGLPFISSCLFIALMLAATAGAVFPTMLPSTLDPANSLTAFNASSGALSLQVGIYWWVLAMIITIGYFVFLYRAFRGKVNLSEGYGH